MFDAFAELNVIPAEVGTSYTFRGTGLGSTLDLISVSAAFIRSVAW